MGNCVKGIVLIMNEDKAPERLVLVNELMGRLGQAA